MNLAQQGGARLEFVVVKLSGKVKRDTHKHVPGKGVVKMPQEQDAGYMVYFPQGHALRIRDAATLKHYGLDREPNIINMSGMHNRSTPIGRFMAAQDAANRRAAWVDMENQVIRLACARTGYVLMPEQTVGDNVRPQMAA